MHKRMMRTLGLVAIASVALVATASAQDGLSLVDFSIDGGGGVSSGDGFSLTGVIAQPDAGTLSGGGMTLLGGILDMENGGSTNPQPNPTPTNTPVVPGVPDGYRVWLPAVDR